MAVLRALLRIIYLFSRADDNIVVVVVCFFLVVFGWGSFAEPFYLRYFIFRKRRGAGGSWRVAYVAAWHCSHDNRNLLSMWSIG